MAWWNGTNEKKIIKNIGKVKYEIKISIMTQTHTHTKKKQGKLKIVSIFIYYFHFLRWEIKIRFGKKYFPKQTKSVPLSTPKIKCQFRL